MLNLNVFIKVKQNKREEFLISIKKMMNRARKEAGNHFYKLYIDDENLTEMVTIEYWEDEKALEFHKNTLEFKQFLYEIEDCLVEPMKFVEYNK